VEAVAAPPQGRGIGVEDLCAAQHRAAPGVPQHQTVPENERQAPVEDEPGVVGTKGTQPGWHGRSAGMHHELLRHIRVGHAGNAVDAQNARDGPRLGGKQRVAAADVGGGNVTQVQCHPVDRPQRGVRRVAALQATDHDGPRTIVAEQLQPVTLNERSRCQCSGHDRSGTGDGKRAVHPQPEPPRGGGGRHPGQYAVERGTQFGQAGTLGGRHSNCGRVLQACSGQLSAGPGEHVANPPGRRPVDPAEDHDAVLDSQRSDGVPVVA